MGARASGSDNALRSSVSLAAFVGDFFVVFGGWICEELLVSSILARFCRPLLLAVALFIVW